VIRRAAIVLNPAGGHGRTGRRRAELEGLLRGAAVNDRGELTWEIHTTSAPGEATEIAARCAADGADIVAAAGGDGTLSEVLNGVVGSKAVLALLPLGTGNDFARTVGYRDGLRGAVEALFTGEARPIDVGRVRGRHFLNVAGCGFDAEVADRANRGPRWLTGGAAYTLAILGTLARFRAADLRLTVDGERRDVRAMLCSVANARTYGGGMRIAPDALLDDGLFDICLLTEAGMAEFLLAFPRVFRGTHTAHPKVTMLRGSVVRVESEPPLPLLIDGEVIGTTPAEFTLCPDAIRFIFPADGR
jgi:diacylglycerol kinase (ATP)